MHAEKPYKIKAFSGNAQGTGSLEGTFTTGKLPSGLPTPTLNVSDLAAATRAGSSPTFKPAASARPRSR